jgi:uncharacterized NAD(P)/FAD-binding protein YdhS
LSIKPIDFIDFRRIGMDSVTARISPFSAPGSGRASVVAVIGGGASGTLTAFYLLREAAAARVPLRIAVIDRNGRHGLGQAYATSNAAHLLNSPAERMSAVAGDPGHLLRWAAARGITRDRFLPRAAFGRYLSELLTDAERTAWPTATLTRITSDVVALTQGGLHRPLRLHLAADGRIDADVAVLATGNRPPAPPCPVPDSPRYVGDPWQPGALDGIDDGSPVVVLGTGLTMLDVAITVTGAHQGTVVHAVSRHALLPREHAGEPGAVAGLRPAASSPGILARGPGIPAGLPGLIRAVRAAAADASGDWQSVVDSLRPHVAGIWQALTPQDKRVFLRSVARYWEVHRHRVPPVTAARIRSLTSGGRLAVHRGRVVAVTEAAGGLRVRIEQDGRTSEIAAGWLVNATGPAADITSTPDPLLRGLLGAGLATPDPLRLGLQAGAAGALLDAAGRPSATLFTLGPPLRGQLYETTAVPEIREQAAALAGRLISALRSRAANESAA